MTAIVETPSAEVVRAADVIASGARLVMMDPRELRIATNVRSELNLTPEFLDSIRQHGVLQPVTAQLAADGVADVLYGQRRTAASVETERPVRIAISFGPVLG